MPKRAAAIIPKIPDNVIAFPVKKANSTMVVLPTSVSHDNITVYRMRGPSLEHRGIFDGDAVILLRQYRGRKIKPTSIFVGWLNGERVAREQHSFTPDFEPEALIIGYQRHIEDEIV